jgi:hypothetical protein
VLQLLLWEFFLLTWAVAAAAQAKPGPKLKGLVSPQRAISGTYIYAGITKEKGHRFVSEMLHN